MLNVFVECYRSINYKFNDYFVKDTFNRDFYNFENEETFFSSEICLENTSFRVRLVTYYYV